jgi:hypothetical protein
MCSRLIGVIALCVSIFGTRAPAEEPTTDTLLIPQSLQPWRPESQTLVAIPVYLPDDDEIIFDRLRLEQNGNTVAHCCGFLLPEESEVEVRAKIRSFCTDDAESNLRMRFRAKPSADIPRTIEQTAGFEPATFGARLAIGRAFVATHDESGALLLRAAGALYLFGENGRVSCLSGSDEERRPVLRVAELDPLIALFAVSSRSRGKAAVRYRAKTLSLFALTPAPVEKSQSLASVPGSDAARAARNNTDSSADLSEKWPTISRPLAEDGKSSLAIHNSDRSTAVVGLRHNGSGVDVRISAGQSYTFPFLRQGTYRLFVRFESNPSQVFRVDPDMSIRRKVAVSLTLGTAVGNRRLIPE